MNLPSSIRRTHNKMKDNQLRPFVKKHQNVPFGWFGAGALMTRIAKKSVPRRTD
jgi:hypothetical protein